MARRGLQLTVPDEGGAIDFVHPNNGDFKCDFGRAGELRHLMVWGGSVMNIGEGVLSQLVDTAAEVLETFTYCPERTKGGALVRPKYYQGDRAGAATFPHLTDMTIRLSPVLLPPSNGWLTPKLRRLRLMCVLAPSRWRTEDWRELLMPPHEDLEAWLGLRSWTDYRTSGTGTLPQRMLRACPELESIVLALCCTTGESLEQTGWVTMLPPMMIPWEVHRLLLLPSVQASKAAGGGAPDGSESPLALLGKHVLDVVLSFLGRRRWGYRWEEIPAEAAERLQLPAAFPQLARELALRCAPSSGRTAAHQKDGPPDG